MLLSNYRAVYTHCYDDGHLGAAPRDRFSGVFFFFLFFIEAMGSRCQISIRKTNQNSVKKRCHVPTIEILKN